MTGSPRSSKSAPGTRPAGVEARDAAGYVREMFTRIAPRYDRANHLLSLGIDIHWRRRAVRALRPLLEYQAAEGTHDGRPMLLLDVCCGTGDLALALATAANGGGKKLAVVGADFAHPMLVQARGKMFQEAARPKRRSANTSMHWVEADALCLPLADGSVDALTTAFGFRNLVDYRAGLREFRRVLRKNGMLLILEFSEPKVPLIGSLYRWYFSRILPRLGGWIAGSEAAYRYLPASVSRFPGPEELSSWMRAEGFSDVRAQRLTGGVAVLYTAHAR
jgi:demethylmenaquinone methyltransferase/2-methoxy-6-polyprenyl-1,4-benzoquinol methylase